MTQGAPIYMDGVSIHAPVKGRLLPAAVREPPAKFQSTPP